MLLGVGASGASGVANSSQLFERADVVFWTVPSFAAPSPAAIPCGPARTSKWNTSSRVSWPRTERAPPDSGRHMPMDTEVWFYRVLHASNRTRVNSIPSTTAKNARRAAKH